LSKIQRWKWEKKARTKGAKRQYKKYIIRARKGILPVEPSHVEVKDLLVAVGKIVKERNQNTKN
jgi:hypothetical protein